MVSLTRRRRLTWITSSQRYQRLLSAILDEARSEGARLVVAEMPDDPAIGQVRALLASVGFEEEARVPDFYRAGVALTLLRREL